MSEYLQILVLVITGIALVWFGFNIIFGHRARVRDIDRRTQLVRRLRRRQPKKDQDTIDFDGERQACPICGTKLKRGELVKTHAFPSVSGSKDRLMHIEGCTYCLNGDLKRNCPICRIPIAKNEILIARVFERTNRHNHVHIVGCIRCRRQ
jgi:endogenous inhibitor of DNA gyrase (YacG/DUF329 family)